ncbi:MAG: YHS domain-containing protein [Chitinophagia bacterium]|jgi:YHS domain-containing protein|nr:YHS domain-containing protein [Chitinophagia bacterium]
MRKAIITLFMCVSMFLIACGNSMNNQANTATDSDTIAAMTTDTASEKTYDVKILDNKKDPTCGMPVTAGVSDTAIYKNKVIGFCSGECKAEFLKNPEANIAAAELIK